MTTVTGSTPIGSTLEMLGEGTNGGQSVTVAFYFKFVPGSYNQS